LGEIGAHKLKAGKYWVLRCVEEFVTYLGGILPGFD